MHNRDRSWRSGAALLAAAATLALAPAALAQVLEQAQQAARIVPQQVRIPSWDPAPDGAPVRLDGWLYRPAGSGPFPAVVGMHGCAGMLNQRGRPTPIYRQWGEALAAQGYLVLFPEGFRSRGFEQVCTLRGRDRPVVPSRQRRADALGALAWLQAHPEVDPTRIALIGWSNGGSTALWSNDKNHLQEAEITRLNGRFFRAAIAFYPGCTDPLRAASWRPQAPLLILIGAADDWTPAAPCESLAQRAAQAGQPVAIRLYPGAHHAFDHPSLPLRERAGLGFSVNGRGTAHVGTDPAARADALARVPAFLREQLGR
ncbi:MAG: dienelactone hydrolase family protein [Alphaproteobacteria bacterium]|nr:dienelactone hydrolase family protein [Alphaproteobacteria bacterium]